MGYSLKETVLKILENEGLESLEKAFKPYPPNKVVSFLIGAFLHPKEEVGWKAILSFGKLISQIAKEDIERARILIRRLMWMLNEESGSMPWGVSEAFAEALYQCEILKKEYLNIFTSYIWKEGNYLEFPLAQRGVIWGVSRLALKYKEELYQIGTPWHIYEHLNSSDEGVKFLVIWCLTKLKPFPSNFKVSLIKIKEVLEELIQKGYQYYLFDGQKIGWKTSSELAQEFLFIANF
ncbi:MAG: hypothetical protein N3A56_07015 [Thermodesulfobacteriaceae bacterium]|nr:hypothetical protein [Thermodesulfobacteriaceae bacterium]